MMRRPSTITTYLVSVIVAAVACLVVFGPTYSVPRWDYVVFLAALTFLAEWFAFGLPVVGSVSLAFAMNYAAVLLGGPLVGALVAAMGAVSRYDIEQGKSPLRMMFNGAQLALSAFLAGSVAMALGMPPLLETGGLQIDGVGWIASAAVTAIVLAASNMLLVGRAISLFAGISLFEVWRESFSGYVVSLLALSLLGVVLAQLIVIAGIPGTLLIVVPFVVSRQTFQVYLKLQEALRDTLKSLVTLVEAKDSYTAGHSERVAAYSRAMAEEMGLSSVEVDRIEYAALLHDIGKVGIRRSTLQKPGALSEQEYGEIRQHPKVGAEIIEEIEILSDAVPLVIAHHEWQDGTGYPQGLKASEICLGARILAVADCYDAMTSTRSYRAAMEPIEAVAELRSACGTQLDTRCVRAFISSMKNQGDPRELDELSIA